MKHHLRLKKAIAFVLAMTMTVTVLTSCDDKDESSSVTESTVSSAAESGTDSSEAPDSTAEPEPTEKEEDPVTASAVKFMSNGKYTTTIKANSADVDLSGLTAENVEVTYIGLEPGTVLAASEEDEESSEAAGDIFGTYVDGERTAKLDSVTKKDDGSWEISFTDENAVKYGTSEYSIKMKDVKATAYVDVEFPEMTLTPDISEVAPSATEVKVTLTLDGGEYADNVTTDMISLANAFYAMDIESVSASGKNLTVLLKGDITTNDSQGAYLFGTVIVAPEAVKDNARELRANVTLLDNNTFFVASTLKFEGGKATVDLRSGGSVDFDKLTKDNIKIDGVTVEKVEKKDDYTASVTLSVKDVKTGSDIVRALSGKEADFNGFKTPLTISPVSFYPVLDFCEAGDSDLRLGLILYAFGGTFNSDLSADTFTFGSDLEGAKFESVKVNENGTNAELVFSVPAGEQTTEDFSFYGDLTIAEGAMTTVWGEKSDEALSYSRDYSNESMGKDAGDVSKWLKTTLMWDENNPHILLNQETLKAIQDWTKGKNTWYGSVLWMGGNIGSLVSFFQGCIGFLEFIGAKKSDQQKLMDELHDIKDMIRDLDAKLEKVRSTLNEMQMELYKNSLEPFDTLRSKFITATEAVQSALARGVNDLKAMGITLPDNATVDQISVYNNQLMTYIYKRAGENNGQNPYYGSFKKNYEKMVDCFDELYDVWLKPSTMRNPFESYDKLYSMMYNFDTESFGVRALIRETVRSTISDAIPLMMIHDNVTTEIDDLEDSHPFKKEYQKFLEMCSFIDDNAVTGVAPDELVFDDKVTEVAEKYGETFISDIIVVGWGKQNECINMLSRQGYNIVNYDLNKKAGGRYIYLGYKTTKKYDEAIKSIRVFEGSKYKKNSVTVDGKTYKLCPYDGDKTFTGDKGELNCKAGGKDLYLFYSKEENDDKLAISGLVVNENKTNAVDGKDLNKGAGGADVFLHVYKSFGSGPIYIKDPELVSGKNAAYKDGVYTIDGKREALDTDLCPAEGHDPLNLSYERTDDYENSVKDFILVPGELRDSVKKDNATYKPVPYSSFKDSDFADAKGSLNYANGGTEIHLYYTTDEVTERGGVSVIYTDNNGTASVSSKSVNMGAPNAPVTYLHLEKIDPESKHLVKKAAGDNPAYHPYCYVLGGTVRYVDCTLTSRKNMKYYKGKALGLSVERNWTDDEVSDFVKRMNGRTFGKEMEMAGMKIPEHACVYTKLDKVEFVRCIKEDDSWETDYYKLIKGNCFVDTSKSLLVGYEAVKSFQDTYDYWYVDEHVKNKDMDGYLYGGKYGANKKGVNDRWGVLTLD